jgi:hypothetical protein
MISPDESQEPQESDEFEQTDQDTQEEWMVSSQKDIVFGFSLILAGIGSEPISLALSSRPDTLLLWISLLVIGIGVFKVYQGVA